MAATTEQEAGQGLTRQAVEQGVDLVLAAGGDGTVMACVTGLAASGVPWRSSPPAPATSPRPTRPAGDLDDVVDVARHGDRRPLDVGALDGGADQAAIASGLGFDAAMLRDANPTMKTRIGPLGLRTQRPAPAAPAPSPFRIRPGRPVHHPRRPGPADRQPRLRQALITVVPDAQPTMACWTWQALGPHAGTGYGWPPRCCCAASVSPSGNCRPGRRWSCSAPDASRSTATGPSRSSGIDRRHPPAGS